MPVESRTGNRGGQAQQYGRRSAGHYIVARRLSGSIPHARGWLSQDSYGCIAPVILEGTTYEIS